MALDDKIQAVQKVSKALEKQAMPEPERMAPNKEHFESLFDAAKNSVSSQKLDGTTVASVDSRFQVPEEQIVLQPENVETNKTGSATDQEQSDSRKKRQQSQSEEVEGVQGISSGRQIQTSKTSLFDEVSKLNGKVNGMAHLTPEDLKNQANGLIAQIEDVKTRLANTRTDIKPSYQTLLQNRLTHIDDNLKIALSKAGVEYVPPAQGVKGSLNPIERFIGFLSNGQHQLENLTQTIDQLNSSQTQLTPASMLAIQIKVGYIQQQIELFTNLLNKALESTKTIMNVQV